MAALLRPHPAIVDCYFQRHSIVNSLENFNLRLLSSRRHLRRQLFVIVSYVLPLNTAGASKFGVGYTDSYAACYCGSAASLPFVEELMASQ